MITTRIMIGNSTVKIIKLIWIYDHDWSASDITNEGIILLNKRDELRVLVLPVDGCLKR